MRQLSALIYSRKYYCIQLLFLVLLAITAAPIYAMEPPGSCDAGNYADGPDGIVATLTGPATANVSEARQFTVTASDIDKCADQDIWFTDTVESFSWFVNDQPVYGNRRVNSSMWLKFPAPGVYHVKVVADDFPYYFDDTPREVTTDVTVTLGQQNYTWGYSQNCENTFSIWLADGSSWYFGLDARDRLISTFNSAMQLRYTLDGVGNRTSVNFYNGTIAPQTTTYGYDALNRLTTINGNAQFAYDWIGNRTVANGVTYTYDNADRLLGGYTYDGYGNLKTASSPSRTYSYDARGLLTTVEY